MGKNYKLIIRQNLNIRFKHNNLSSISLDNCFM